jgi:predicted RNA-binding Zn ribbon-like protein
MLDPGSYEGTYTADAGALCLDFANTLSWRLSDHPHEWLNDYDDLLTWGELVGVLTADEVLAMHVRCSDDPAASTQVLRRAFELRMAIYQIFSAVDCLATPPEEAIKSLNAELAIANQRRSLHWNGAQFEWYSSSQPGDLDKVLWPIALSAAELLNSPDINRVGVCQGEECGWLFLDTSKNHSRRWCSMEDCGNREKARKHYRRKRQAATDS